MQAFNPYGKIKKEAIEETTLRNLADTIEFHSALNTDIGKLLFNDLLLLLDEKFKLIYEEKSTERDRAIFSACKIIGNRWNEIIKKHDVNLAKYKVIKDLGNKQKVFK